MRKGKSQKRRQRVVHRKSYKQRGGRRTKAEIVAAIKQAITSLTASSAVAGRGVVVVTAAAVMLHVLYNLYDLRLPDAALQTMLAGADLAGGVGTFLSSLSNIADIGLRAPLAVAASYGMYGLGMLLDGARSITGPAICGFAAGVGAATALAATALYNVGNISINNQPLDISNDYMINSIATLI